MIPWDAYQAVMPRDYSALPPINLRMIPPNKSASDATGPTAKREPIGRQRPRAFRGTVIVAR
jgi:hypothetical protein